MNSSVVFVWNRLDTLTMLCAGIQGTVPGVAAPSIQAQLYRIEQHYHLQKEMLSRQFEEDQRLLEHEKQQYKMQVHTHLFIDNFTGWYQKLNLMLNDLSHYMRLIHEILSLHAHVVETNVYILMPDLPVVHVFSCETVVRLNISSNVMWISVTVLTL